MIPKVIYQTWKRELPDRVKGLVDWMRGLNPEYEYRFFDDAAMDAFVQEHGPKVNERVWVAYQRLGVGAARADLWRYLLMYVWGGVYLDVDSLIVRPLREMIRGDEMGIVSREGHSGLFVQWMLVFAPGCRYMRECVVRCVENVLEGESEDIMEVTGPRVYSGVLGGCGNGVWELEDGEAGVVLGEGVRVFGMDYEGFGVYNFKGMGEETELMEGHWSRAGRLRVG
jgi:inositol phosphorylceramide mannosyltransferase catalytic subunit